MTIYDRAKVTADKLLDPANLGVMAGAIVLTRQTVTSGANPWDDPTITSVSEGLRAQAFGVSSVLVGSPANEPDGPVILASDRMVIAALPSMGYSAGDILSIDGAAVTILQVNRIPAAGVTSAVKFLVRGGNAGAFGGGGDPPPVLPGDDW